MVTNTSDGLCHICQKQTIITYCKLCGHWFCKICYGKWGGRAIAFLEHSINPKQACCGPDAIINFKHETRTERAVVMAKTIEQFVQESLGVLTFQILMIQAQLEAEKEKSQLLEAELVKLKEEKK